MNRYSNILRSILLCSVTTTALASSSSFFTMPYLGIEAIQTNQSYKQGYGKDVYRRNPQDYNAFLGFKLSRCLGVEGGYEFQPKVGKTVTLNAGQYEPGRSVIILPTSSVRMNSHIEGHHPYIALFVEADQAFTAQAKVKLQGMFGVSYSHIKAQDVVQSINGIPMNIVNNYSKHKVIPMAKITATHNLNNNLGIRLSLNYHNFEKFNIQASDGGQGQIKLKDTFGVGLGLTYSVC